MRTKTIIFLTVILTMMSSPLISVNAEGMSQSIPISGEALDADNLPLPGVTVMVQGTTVGTATDLDGKFTLAVPGENSVLLFSCTGSVVDAGGEAITGACIAGKGAANGVVTDIDGRFVLNVRNESAVLQISYTGYATQEITAGSRTVLDVLLEESSPAPEDIINNL
jgi:hypothetical protein